MKIGSQFPIISNPGRQPGQAINPDRSQTSAANDQLPQRSSPQEASYSDYIAAVEQNAATRDTGFYNMDRELPHRGQAALTAYLTTEGFQTHAQGELVGVDLYV